MTSVVGSPPDPFPAINVHLVKSGTPLYRTHQTSFGPAQFNPCKGQPTRFAPFTDTHGRCVPTLYAATSREAAAFESIFHDIDAKAAFKTVRLQQVTSRSVSEISPKRHLKLAGLFAPDLKAWGIERAELIDTPKSTYGQTVLWARAIHCAEHAIDGLIWTSRQCDPERCLVLFEDRIQEDDFDVLERRDVASDAALLLELRGYGQRAGISIVS